MPPESYLEVFECTLDCEVASKKNGKIPRFHGGKLVGMIENPRSRKSQREVEAQFLTQRAKNKMDATPVYSREVSLQLEVQIDRDTGRTQVRLSPIGLEPTKGKNGRKRDIQNELALLCDAIEKAGLVANDNQIARIVVERIVQGSCR